MKRANSHFCRFLYFSVVYLCLLVCASLFENRAEAVLPGWIPNDVHQYADAAACQMGGGEKKYLPADIMPEDGEKIPIYWNDMEVQWCPDKTDKACDSSKGIGEYKIEHRTKGFQSAGKDPEGKKCVGGAKDGNKCNDNTDCPGGGACKEKDWPEEGVTGSFTNPNGTRPDGTRLRCDHFPYVESTCTTDQSILELEQSGITWHVLFRRTGAPAKRADNDPKAMRPLDWGPNYIPYYDVVDAIGLNEKTYGVVWLDGLKGAAAKSFENGFRIGPMPRPGGKRPEWRKEGVRASLWFDTTAQMKGGQCHICHGTPFNGSDWIDQQRMADKPKDDFRPYWHAGNEVLQFDEQFFFNTVKKGDNQFTCSGCHRQWMSKSGSTPGGEIAGGMALARLMTMVHDQHMDNPFKVLATEGNPVAYTDLASSFRTDKSQLTFLDKNANQTHWMPSKRNRGSVKQWNDAFRERYNMLACCGADLAGKEEQPPNTDPFPDPITGKLGFDCKEVKCQWTGKFAKKDRTPLGMSDVRPDFFYSLDERKQNGSR